MYFVFDGLRDRHKIESIQQHQRHDWRTDVIAVHPDWKCELSCHLLTCHIVQKGL